MRILVVGLFTLGCHKGTAIIDMRDTGTSTAPVEPDCQPTTEICDGVDNDCDGEVDEALLQQFFADADADTFGDPDGEHWACDQPVGFVENDADCDDSNAAVNPNAFEICDEIDNDCDAEIDEDQPTQVWYPDLDGDGYGDEDNDFLACREPESAVEMPGDCDDTDEGTYPGAPEVCDHVDQDCDGQIDESVTTSFYRDDDGDGWGTSDPEGIQDACELPDGYSESGGDCDDASELAYPGAEDVCDGVDNNCDGIVDEDGGDACESSPVFSEDFSAGAWGEWFNLALSESTAPVETWGTGDAEWFFSDGALCEESDMGNEFALGPEIGAMDAYAVSVDIQVNGDANNGVGLVFSYERLSAIRMVIWADPLAYYDWTEPPSIISLYERAGSSWEMMTDSGGLDVTAEDGVWSTLTVEVAGDDVEVSLDGAEVFSATTTLDTGPFRVGVWTWDNDGGVCFDNVAVSAL